jgi:hypothetical protein
LIIVIEYAALILFIQQQLTPTPTKQIVAAWQQSANPED